MDVSEFVATDRDIAALFGRTPDTLTRLSIVREAIAVGEAVARTTSTLDELADVALRCASSYVLLNELLGSDAHAATAAATWAARAAESVKGRPAAELRCLPHAAAVVAAVAGALPRAVHHQAVMRAHAWLVRLAAALDAAEAAREEAEVAWRVALAARSVAGLGDLAELAAGAAADAFREAADEELAGLAAAT